MSFLLQMQTKIQDDSDVDVFVETLTPNPFLLMEERFPFSIINSGSFTAEEASRWYARILIRPPVL